MFNPISFDTREFFKDLTKAGMPEEQADALTVATTKAFTQMMQTNDLVTKDDLDNMEKKLQLFIVKCMTFAGVILSTFQAILIHFH